MATTNEKKIAKAIADHFTKNLVPLAKSLKEEGIEFYPSGPDESQSTYYIKREKTTMAREDFEIGHCETPQALAEQLLAMWKQQGCDQLEPLAKPLAKLAETLYAVEEQNEEVSPFIYVMY